MSATQVDVNVVLDGSRFRGLPLVVMAFAACITILDGFDIQIMGLASPALARDWGIERPALVPTFAAALIGMAVGGFVLGAVGDRSGRRPAILASVLIFAIGTLATKWVPDVPTLIALRFLTGVGLGGALPNATALMSEFAPPRFRGQAIAATIIGVPIGGMLGAVIAAQVVPIFGWRILFAIGGILPLAALVGIYFALPESARFLAAYPGRRAELARVLNRVVGAERFSATQDFSIGVSAPVHHAGPRALFSRTLLWDTTALWLAFITNLFAVYCFYNWAPVVFTGFGMDMPTALRGLFVFNAAGVVGSLAASWLIARVGSRWIQAGLGIIAILSLLHVRSMLDGSGARNSTAILSAIGIAGFCIVAIQVTLFSVAAHVYPTHCRAAGVGWAQGVGRFGGVLSAFAGAMFVGISFFTGIAVTLALTLVAILILRNHLSPVLLRDDKQATDLGRVSGK